MPGGSGGRLRHPLSALALLLGALLLAGSLASGIVNREVLDAGRFSRHVDAIRMDPAVAQQIGTAITDRVLQLDPDLVAIKPVIQTTATGLVRSSVLTPIVLTAARQLHVALTRPRSQQVLLRLVDVGAILVPTLRALAPRLAATLPDDFDVTLARIGAQDFAGRTIRAAHLARLLSWLLALLAASCFALAVLLSLRRRRAVARIGWAVAGAAVVVGVALVIGDATLGSARQSTLRGAIASTAWRRLTAPAGPLLVAVFIGGLLIAAVTTGAFEGAAQDAAGWARRTGRTLTARPERAAGRWGRAGLLVAAGVLLLFRPGAAGRVLAFAAGAGLLILGAQQLGPSADRPAAPARRPGPARWRPRSLLAGAMAGALLVAGVVTAMARPTVGDDPAPGAATPPQTCNGFAALCARPYDTVAFPATHNSMAAADQPGWFFAEQPDGIVAQLNAGISTLLIDTWLGRATNRAGVVTTVGGLHAQAVAQSDAAFGSHAVAAALRVRDATGLTPTGPAEPYLCHGLCELGATRWEPVMADLKTWMADHPRQVVTLFIQDEGVTPAQTDGVFRQAGLLPYVHTQTEGQAWPTLGEMISSGRRLVVFMEKQDGSATYPWQMPAFTWTQDTPYKFTTAASFTCDRLRGRADSPLLLVNHWLTNPASRVTDAATVNGWNVLWPRLSACREERGRIPNFVAVDYYDEGDLFAVVDQLNGV